MKSKLKKLMAAAAVSLAFAAPASAAIQTGDGATLFLEVYDSVSGQSYVRDLGVSINNFGTQNRPTGGFTNIMDNQAGDTFSSATDANWTTFVAAVGANVSGLIWDVIASDGLGTSSADTRRVLFTSLTDAVAQLAVLTAPNTQTNAA